jgi:hypothetical protein
MADKRKTKDSILVETAKAIGTAAEKVVSLAGAAPDRTPPPAKSAKKGKLPKKDKPHLPRRLKKAQKKAAALSSPNA